MNIYRMLYRTLLLIPAAGVLGCGGDCLPRDNWDGTVHRCLGRLVSGYGNTSGSYDPECRPYAVFDFDNTVVMNDISMTLIAYMIENMRFAFAPDEAAATLTCGFAPDVPLKGCGGTVGDFAQRLAADYAVLKDFLACGGTVDMMHRMPEYLDFRARLWSMSFGVEITFGTDLWLGWLRSLLSGISAEGLAALAEEAADDRIAAGRIWEEEWSSPDGSVSVKVPQGLFIPQESRHLFHVLAEHGFDVYICSASLEIIVEAIACNPKYGLGLDPEHVFGIRYSGKDMFGGSLAEDYDQPYAEGKTRCIAKNISPRHCGRGPCLVAGDSNGDFSMLTSFPDMKAGLVIDCGRSGDIASLCELALRQTDSDSPRYLVQKRDLSVPCYISSGN